jgi:hypothetical protein
LFGSKCDALITRYTGTNSARGCSASTAALTLSASNTTFFNIEQDEVTSLSAITQVVPYEVTASENMFETVSNASTITKQMQSAVITPRKRLQ